MALGNSKLRDEQKASLRALLARDDVEIVVGPKLLPNAEAALKRWEGLSEEEIFALSKDEVEYYVVSHGNLLDSSFKGLLTDKFVRTYTLKNEQGEVTETLYFNRLQGEAVHYLSRLFDETSSEHKEAVTPKNGVHLSGAALLAYEEEKREKIGKAKEQLGRRKSSILFYDKSGHSYAGFLPVLSDLAIDSAAIAIVQMVSKEKDDYRPALLFQVPSKDSAQLRMQLQKAFRSAKIDLEDHENGITSVLVSDVPDSLLDIIATNYPEYIVENDENTPYHTKYEVFHAYDGDEALIDPPAAVVAQDAPKRRRREKPSVTQDVFVPLSEEQLKARLQETGASIRCLQDITGNKSGYEIHYANPTRMEDMSVITRSLLHHTINNSHLSHSLARSAGGISYFPHFSEVNRDETVKKIEALCGSPVTMRAYQHPVESLSFASGLQDGILNFDDIEVYYHEGRGSERKPKKMGQVSIHAAPIVKDGKQQIAILVNAPIATDNQLKPILDLLRVRRNALHYERQYSENQPYTLVTVDIPDRGVFQGLLESFKTPNGKPVSLDKVMEKASTTMPEWIEHMPVPRNVTTHRALQHLVFVSSTGEASAKRMKQAITGSSQGRFRKEKKRGPKGSEPQSGKDHSQSKREEASDEFAEDLLAFAKDDLQSYQVRIAEPAEGAEKRVTLVMALTRQEYGGLQSMLTHAKLKNSNKSGIRAEMINAHHAPWNEDHVYPVKLEIPEGLAPLFTRARFGKLDAKNGLDEGFTAHVKSHAEKIKAESERQQKVTVSVVDQFADALVVGKAAMGYIEYPSAQRIAEMIAHKEQEKAAFMQLKDSADALRKIAFESQERDVANMDMDVIRAEHMLRMNIENALSSPDEVIEEFDEYIGTLKAQQHVIDRYKLSDNTAVKIPVLMVRSHSVVQDRGKNSDHGTPKGLFSVISASIEDPTRLHENADPQVKAKLGTAQGLQVLEARNKFRIGKTKKNKKGTPAAWFMLSPELGRAITARVHEEGYSVHTIAEPLRIPELHSVMESKLVKEQAEAKHVAKVTSRERLFGGIKSSALVIYEGKQQQVPEEEGFVAQHKKVGVTKEHKGAQPTLYLVVDAHNRKDAAALLSSLYAEEFIVGEKQYHQIENHEVMQQFADYYAGHYERYVDFLDEYESLGTAFHAQNVLRGLQGDKGGNYEFSLQQLRGTLDWLAASEPVTGDIGASKIRSSLDKLAAGETLPAEEQQTLVAFLERASKLRTQVRATQHDVSDRYFANLSPEARDYLESKNIDALDDIGRIDAKDHQFYTATYDGPSMQVLGENGMELQPTHDAKVLTKQLEASLETAVEASGERKIIVKVPLNNEAVEQLNLDQWRHERAQDFSPKARSTQKWADGVRNQDGDKALKMLENVTEHRGGRAEEVAGALAQHFGVGGIAGSEAKRGVA